MTVQPDEQIAHQAVVDAARQMILSGRTAPKSGAIDDLKMALVTGDDIQRIADEILQIGKQRDPQDMLRWTKDAASVEQSAAVILMGIEGKSLGYGLEKKGLIPLDCGACGYATCEALDKKTKKKGDDFRGPLCVYKLLDLGVALGSAVKTAGLLNVDNRIMYKIGTAAMRLNLIEEVDICMGIPLSGTGKNIYFDRTA